MFVLCVFHHGFEFVGIVVLSLVVEVLRYAYLGLSVDGQSQHIGFRPRHSPAPAASLPSYQCLEAKHDHIPSLLKRLGGFPELLG